MPNRPDQIMAGAKAISDYMKDLLLPLEMQEKEFKTALTRISAAVLLAADETPPQKGLLSNIINRLRGIYTLAVADGAGLLNGKDTFTRAFTTPPIQQEAAAIIALLVQVLDDISRGAENPKALAEAALQKLKEEFGV